MVRMTMEKKVVVPTRIHSRWPSMNQETNAPHSSAFQGRMLRIECHLNRACRRCQKPVAAARNSSLVGRGGIFGRWDCRYFDMEAAMDSASPGCGGGGGGGSGTSSGLFLCASSSVVFFAPPLVVVLSPRWAAFQSGSTRLRGRDATPCSVWWLRRCCCCCCWFHACRAARPMLAFFWAVVPPMAVSAAAVQVATTEDEDVDGELRPRSRSPPEVQLRRTTLFGEILPAGALCPNSRRLLLWKKDRRAGSRPMTCAANERPMPRPVSERWAERTGRCHTHESSESRMVVHTWRPS